MGTEQGTEILVLGKFDSVLDFFGSVLGKICPGLLLGSHFKILVSLGARYTPYSTSPLCIDNDDFSIRKRVMMPRTWTCFVARPAFV